MVTPDLFEGAVPETVEAGFALVEAVGDAALVARAAGRGRGAAGRDGAGGPLDGRRDRLDALGAPARDRGGRCCCTASARCPRRRGRGRRSPRTSPSPTRSRRRSGSPGGATPRPRGGSRRSSGAIRARGTSSPTRRSRSTTRRRPPCSGAARATSSPPSDGRGPLPAEKETRIGMTPKDASAYAREICGLAPVIPVLVVHDVAHAVPLAEALVAGGLPVLEVTLRTPAALEVIRAMAEVAGGVVGRRHAADARGRAGGQGGRGALRGVAGRHRRAGRGLRGRRSCRSSAASPPSARRCGCSSAATRSASSSPPRRTAARRRSRPSPGRCRR